jgi:hypothetical protein
VRALTRRIEAVSASFAGYGGFGWTVLISKAQLVTGACTVRKIGLAIEPAFL